MSLQHGGGDAAFAELFDRVDQQAHANLLNRPQQRDLTWEEVLKEEENCIETLRSERPPEPSSAGSGGGGGSRSKRFSLAFSGGGMRAAAWQSGVLWRLAKEDRLKDVDYWVAVSGGGYITSAFASHCLGEDPPREGESSREWYMKVVAKTICRMQANGGDFVRDCWANPGKGADGAGNFPRWLDLPLLLGTILVTLLIGPVSFLVAFLVPMTIILDLFFGPMLRAWYCMDHSDLLAQGILDTWGEVWRFMWQYSAMNILVIVLAISCVLTFTIFVLRMCCPSMRLRPPEKEGDRPDAPVGYQAAHAMQAFFVRTSVFAFILIVFVILLNWAQGLAYTDAARQKQCETYIGIEKPGKYLTTSLSPTCSNSFPPSSGTLFWNWENYTIVNATYDHPTDPDDPKDPDDPNEKDDEFTLSFFGLLAWVFAGLAGFSCCFCLLMPCLGGGLMIWFMANFIGPALVAVASICCCEYCIYGPITGNDHGSFLPWDPVRWKVIGYFSLCLVLFLSVFFEEIKGLLHTYYKKSLRQNFFHQGKDVRFRDLADSSKGGARMCPFIMLTVTSSDYQPPGDTDTISELSLSSLHCGGEETGYIRQPSWFSLAKSTALTGAGCLDAISLSMSDQLSLRFWLEFLSLSWGDYILFEGKSRLFDFAQRMGERFHSDHLGRFMVRVVHRAPAGICWLVCYGVMLVGFTQATDAKQTSSEPCSRAASLYWASMGIFFFVLFCSFFSFCPGFDLFSLSSISRLILQATQYFYVGNKPPRMLYVTDGGVKDCTGIIQLMMRRRERIILALAGADPSDDLGVLKTAMDVAQQLKIGSFFDPDAPHRSLSVKLERFKKDKSMPYLHIGICYSWGEETGGANTADLYVVKHRLPDGFEHMPVQPLLTEAEIVAGRTSERGEALDRANMEEWGDLTTDQLGPMGCCDCCHTRGWNCGNPFPHGGFSGYLYLTPMWVNSLSRLGYGASKQTLADCYEKWWPTRAE